MVDKNTLVDKESSVVHVRYDALVGMDLMLWLSWDKQR